MTRPTVGDVTENAYARLPLFVREDDEGLDYPLLAWLSAALDQADSSATMLAICDPDQSTSGTVELTNPYYCPAAWLPWLGWLVGLNTSTTLIVTTDYESEISYQEARSYSGDYVSELSKSTIRDTIANYGTTRLRGSRAAIAFAVQKTLTGTQWVQVDTASTGVTAWTYEEAGEVYEDPVRAYSGDIRDPYEIAVTVLASECADSALTEAAALTEKPAGCTLTVITI